MREVLADHLAGGDLSAPAVRAHPLAAAADADAAERAAGADPWSRPALGELLHLARQSLSASRRRDLAALARAYSTHDPELVVEIFLRFAEWYALGRLPVYRDWTVAGRGDPDFGVVEQRLAGDARIAVIGDWGTGLDDARAMLLALLRELRPSALVHLGDIYYTGTPREASQHFGDVLDAAFREVPPRIPVFTLPGNHDYYSGGRGFYGLLDRLNAPPARQAASYLCLRSADSRWQLAGVDTGFHARNPGAVFDPFATGPHLRRTETDWLRHKLEGFGGRTILLSHHPPYSARHAINGPASRRPPNLNEGLLDAVRPHLDRVALWMWGHEHSLAIYAGGIHGLARGRLVGCSGFETAVFDDPYAVRFPGVAFHSPPVRLSAESGWYDHGLALVDLGAAAVEYYQFPTWSGAAPDPPPRLSPLFRESLDG